MLPLLPPKHDTFTCVPVVLSGNSSVIVKKSGSGRIAARTLRHCLRNFQKHKSVQLPVPDAGAVHRKVNWLLS